MIVRELRMQDVEEVSRIEEQCFSMPWSAKDFVDLVRDEHSLYLVAEENGILLGCAGMTDVAGEGNINNVAVLENHRGRGVAVKLLTELLSRGGEMGIQAYTLEVRVSNAPAIHVYEKLGFVSEGIRPGFYEKPVEDAVIMWKRQ